MRSLGKALALVSIAVAIAAAFMYLGATVVGGLAKTLPPVPTDAEIASMIVSN